MIKENNFIKKSRIPWNKGKIFLAMVGNTQGFKKNNIPWNKNNNGDYMRGDKNPSWRGGLPKCLNCGKELKNRKAKHCLICWFKIRPMPKSIFKKGHLPPKTAFKKGVISWNKNKKLGFIPKMAFKKNDERLVGKNNSAWKGGITPLSIYLKTKDMAIKWKKYILKRDNYICRECFKTGGKLNIHHIKPFSFIMQEFLQQYSQFSPIEDKETLIRLAQTYEPFWDVNNGIVLCQECHLSKKEVHYDAR